KVALDVHARQPDSDVIEQRPIRQSAVPEELRLGQSEETEIRLIVDDAGGVDVFPSNVFGDGELHVASGVYSLNWDHLAWSRRRRSRRHLVQIQRIHSTRILS